LPRCNGVDDKGPEYAFCIHRRAELSDRPRASRIVAPHRVRGAWRNDHFLATAQSVSDACHTASDRAFEHLQPLFLLRMYMVPNRRRDLPCDVLEPKHFAGRVLGGYQHNYAILRSRALCPGYRHHALPHSDVEPSLMI